MILEPTVETLPWPEQVRKDDALYREQIKYLFANSPFYQQKLRKAGFETPADVGGLEDIGKLPTTEKDELRATRSADGRRLVWASNRDGGAGGWDLWQATWQDARWSDPRPLPLDTAAPMSAAA